ncbi:hypothetical protein HMPREF0293_1671, partial [Corynebacterium glucuronolyticum ATCC 51866]
RTWERNPHRTLHRVSRECVAQGREMHCNGANGFQTTCSLRSAMSSDRATLRSDRRAASSFQTRRYLSREVPYRGVNPR